MHKTTVIIQNTIGNFTASYDGKEVTIFDDRDNEIILQEEVNSSHTEDISDITKLLTYICTKHKKIAHLINDDESTELI